MYRVDACFAGMRDLRSLHYGDGGWWQAFSSVDAVYSFRTGTSANPVTGIVIPDFSRIQKPADRVRALGRFYADFSESAAASSAAAFEEGSYRYSKTDVGHEFLSIKGRASGPDSLFIRKDDQARSVVPMWTGWEQPLLPPQNGMMDKFDSYWNYTYKGDILRGSLLSSYWMKGPEFAPQSVLNELFSRVRASRPALNIGETILEFVRDPFALVQGLLTMWRAATNLFGRSRLNTLELVLGTSSLKGNLQQQLKDAKKSAHELGGAYLAGLFGASPFLQDVVKTVDFLTTVHSVVYGQSERFKRSTVLRTESTTLPYRHLRTTGFGYKNPAGSGQLASACEGGPISMTRSWDTRLSARVGGLGRPSDTQDSFISRADGLLYNLGLQEPQLMWDLTSFSWLLDWCLHLGTSIGNAYALSGSGRSVDYAYATTKVKTLVTQMQSRVIVDKPSYPMYESHPGGLAKTYVEYTVRRRATPFGFGGDLSSLTSGQMSILTALGLAKTR